MTENRPSQMAHPSDESLPYVDSDAAQMLRAGLEHLSRTRGTSGRALARQLDMKTSVMISHWATGRIPIPVDRCVDMAKALDMDPAIFLRAVLRQRHPKINWLLLSAPTPEEAAEGAIETELRNLAGRPLAQLSVDHLRVLYEVAADPQASRRWLTVPEITTVQMLRDLRPGFRSEGLSPADRQALSAALRESSPK